MASLFSTFMIFIIQLYNYFQFAQAVIDDYGAPDVHLLVGNVYKDDIEINNIDIITAAVVEMFTTQTPHWINFGNLTSSCKRDLQFAQDTWYSLANCSKNVECNQRYHWIREVLDSQGRRPAGVWYGNKYWLGSYRQCSAIKQVSDNLSGQFIGQHCKTKQRNKSLRSITLSICAPKSCSGQDLFNIISGITRLQDFSVSCEQRLSIFSDYSALAAIAFCFVLTCILVAATIVDTILFQGYAEKAPDDKYDPHFVLIKGLHKANVKGTCARSLLAFSILSNGAKLFSTNKISGQIECLHGIRFLSICWVILYHNIELFISFDNVVYLWTSTKGNVFSGIIMHGRFAVDTFFLLSGLLLAFTWHKEMSNAKENVKSAIYWLKFYLHRYIRLTPPYAIIIWLFSNLYYYLSDGPLWPEQTHFCQASWWHNLLYINNIIEPRACMVWTWYMAADFQLFIFAPLILVLLYSYPKIAYATCSILLSINIFSRGITFALNNFPPLCLPGLPDPNVRYGGSPAIFECEKVIYFASYFRYGPYLIGLLLGHFLFKFNKRCRQHCKVFKLTISILSLGIFLALLAVPYLIDYLPTWANGFYSGISRTLWSLIVVWLIYACASGNAVTINAFLSMKIWLPLSRLSYCIYLIHFIVYYYIFESTENAIHFDSNMTPVFQFAKCLFVTLPLAVIANLALEMPTLELDRIFIKPSTSGRIAP